MCQVTTVVCLLSPTSVSATQREGLQLGNIFESLLDIFKIKMSSTNFDILSEMPVQQMVESFQQIVNSLLCEVFPEKVIIISPEDRPWFNEQLRLLKRQRMRQYQRHGKNDKYDELKTRFDEKLKHEMLKYLEK